MFVCEQVELALHRELEEEVRRAEKKECEKRQRGEDTERQTVLRACVMLSGVRAVNLL